MPKVVEMEQAKRAHGKPGLLQWSAWDTPERIAGSAAIKDGTGDTHPRLMFVTFNNGSLKVLATRRPAAVLSEAARIARAMHTWIDGALVSEPELRLGRVALLLVKQLRIEGRRYIGQGVFEGLGIREALAALAQIREIDEPPEPPTKEPTIPDSLLKRKGEQMQNAETIPTITIASTPIRQDDAGRFCLNDLHKAAGGEKHYAPNEWMRNKQTEELIDELTKPEISGLEKNQPVSVIRGGSSPGTYVCKELVYAYAMWISPKFHLQVIRAFDDLVMGRRPQLGNALPDVVASAIKSRAWRLAEEYRIHGMRLIAGAMRPGDEEPFWEISARAMERLEETLSKLAREMLTKGHKPQQAAAVILAWQPQLAEWERRLH